MFKLKNHIVFLIILKIVELKYLKVLFWIDPIQRDIYVDLKNALNDVNAFSFDIALYDMVLEIDSLNENPLNDDLNNGSMNILCEIMSNEGISIVLDFTYYIWHQGVEYITKYHIPYLRLERMLNPFMRIYAEFLKQEDNVNNIAIIFQNQRYTTEALLQVIEGFPFRTLILNDDITNNELTGIDFIENLKQLQALPSSYAIFSGGSNMNVIYEKIHQGKLRIRPTDLHFVFLDPKDHLFKYKNKVDGAVKFTMNARIMCKLLLMKESYCLNGFSLQRALIFDILRNLLSMKYYNNTWLNLIKIDSNESQIISGDEFNIYEHFIPTDFISFTSNDNHKQLPLLTFSVNMIITSFTSNNIKTMLAVWQNGTLYRVKQNDNRRRRFFRIGVTEAVPWSYHKQYVVNRNISVTPVWEGFCIDMIQALSQKMDFDYELLLPTEGKFGEQNPLTGQWDGIVGDLVKGRTDFAVAPLKMYSEREEVIDFVAPYFEQTGISIVMRKPVRKVSLFKFMTVLKLEVWISIICALTATSLLIWILDKYSPYSYYNNRNIYPYPCRVFTLRESFWFAITSFTPQGGGETPKSISGRVLVAAYWLFVVLMLATFTANLAAFLTVERMQTPLQSLDQLAGQSRINYTVVQESDTHHYFINMKFAEDTLYRLWKELALNSSKDHKKFRVWDYPIKEQYGHLLEVINNSRPVKNAEEGFHRVNANNDFAFIHDAAEIKYEITRNCNLTEVGEVFAEQQYAVSVQQGSHLIDELTYTLLELQNDHFLENLKAKYWNYSRLNCPSLESQQGISLESLGGVFIATAFGLCLAIVILVFEILYYKKKHSDNPPGVGLHKHKEHLSKTARGIFDSSNAFNAISPYSTEQATFRGRKIPSNITLGTEFKPKHLPNSKIIENSFAETNNLNIYYE